MWKKYFIFFSVNLQAVFLIVSALYFGEFLEKKDPAHPWTLGLVCLAFILSGYNFFAVFRFLMKGDKK